MFQSSKRICELCGYFIWICVKLKWNKLVHSLSNEKENFGVVIIRIIIKNVIIITKTN
jgi:hypothetical protein